MKTLKMRFKLELDCWVTVERSIEDDFDVALMDVPRSYEKCRGGNATKPEPPLRSWWRGW